MRKELADLGIPSTVILDSAVGYGLLFSILSLSIIYLFYTLYASIFYTLLFSILFPVYHLLIFYSLCKHFLHPRKDFMVPKFFEFEIQLLFLVTFND